MYESGMIVMPSGDQRQALVRFCLLALGWPAAAFGWACVLSFSVADPPATLVWPPANPPHNLCGHTGAWLAYHAFCYVGIGVYPVLVLMTAALLAGSSGRNIKQVWLRCVGLVLVVAAIATAGTLAVPNNGVYPLAGAGGYLGAAAAQFFHPHLQTLGTSLLLTAVLLVGLLLAADELLTGLLRFVRWAGVHSAPGLVRGGSAVAGAGAALATSVANLGGRAVGATSAEDEDEPSVSSRSRKKAAEPAEEEYEEEPEDEEEEWEEEDDEAEYEDDEEEEEEDDPEDEEDEEEEEEGDDEVEDGEPVAPEPVAAKGPLVREIGARLAPRPKAPPPPPPRLHPEEDNYELPALDVLEPATLVDKGSIEALCRDKAFVLERTLNEFKLAVEVVSIETGPVITVFELKLAPGIKVSQIASLTNDMARALKAPAVRVVAPLPGKNTIGIEVPNIDKEKVRLRDVIEMAAGRTNQYAIPLFLGKDAAGQPLVTDLTRMPHLLIAGTTGSGKSVCVTSIIMSVLMTRAPSEVNLILVDPKVVELASYKDVPHLMCPIVTEVSKAEAILEWASIKMDERYALLAEAGVRDIRSYNRLGQEGLRERLKPSCDEEMAKVPTYLPYFVIIIDELADLMMTSAKEVEFFLCRIAQKSRAVGIHLIVSTQRPQANVVTGLIKSNLPSRIAFRVASRLDSRIVLDQNGGEVLMGQGDMLFLPPGQSKLVRAQGTFVEDEELRNVVKHCREQREPIFHPELVRLPGAGGDTSGERDELFDEAVDIIVQTGRGSVSLLQRRLNVGYSRASRLIDQMYEAGIVGEYKGSQAREVMVTREEWNAIRDQRDQEEAEEAAEISPE